MYPLKGLCNLTGKATQFCQCKLGPVAVMRQAFQKRRTAACSPGITTPVPSRRERRPAQKGAFVKHEEIIATPKYLARSQVEGWADATKLRAGDILSV